MNRVNFKNINTKSVDQSYFKPKVNVKVKKEVEEKSTETKSKYQKFDIERFNGIIYDDIGINIDKPLGMGIYQQIRQKDKYTKVRIIGEIKPNCEISEEKLTNICQEIYLKTEKIEKPKEEITKTSIANDKRHYSDYGFSGWHCHCKYSLNGSSIKLTDNVGGCGVQQLYGWAGYCDSPHINKLLDHVLSDLNYGTSILLCQVGSGYYNTRFCKKLEELGFKYHEEYKNHQHGGRDTGRIYSLIITKKSEENNKEVVEG